MVATIKDIAKLAGVSVTTVSRALNNHADVNPVTKKKVIKVAKQLNYQPNLSARNLVLKKTNTIGLIVSGLTASRTGQHHLFDIICGINEQANLQNYDVLLYGTSSKKQNEITFLDLCRKRNFDGVILTGVRTNDLYIKQVLEADIPTVLLGMPRAARNCGSVITDNFSGSRMAVHHLIESGHRHILLVNGHKETVVSFSRLDGYYKALEEHNIPFRDEYVAFADFEIEGAANAVEHLLKENPMATAVFCASDLMAYGVMQKVVELGLKVPDDISIVGFDGIQLSEIMKPSLTTIQQDRYHIGVSAVNMLMELFDGVEGYTRVLTPKLVIRDSTKVIAY